MRGICFSLAILVYYHHQGGRSGAPGEDRTDMEPAPFFSVVMPAFRVERTLKRAVQSVLAQRFQELELIVVDDASPDGTGALADHLAGGDARMRVIHLPQNQGLSGARNAGLACCRGRYVVFVDSDDFLEPNLLEAVARGLSGAPAQMAVWGVTEEHFDASGAPCFQAQIRPEPGYFDRPDELRAQIMVLETQTLWGYAWNKAYERAFLEEVGARFEPVELIEDVLFNLACARGLERLMVLGETGYHYQRRGEGLTARFLPGYFELNARRLSELLDLYRAWGQDSPQLRARLGDIYIRYLLSALQRNCDPRAGMDGAARRAWLRAQFDAPLYRELAPHFCPSNPLVRLAGGLMGRRALTGCLALGRGLALVEGHAPRLMRHLKRNR